MRFSAKTWVIIAIVLLALSAGFWQWGNRVQEQKNRAVEGGRSGQSEEGTVHIPTLGGAGHRLLTALDTHSRHASVSDTEVSAAYRSPIPKDPQHPYRLRNTASPLDQLAHLNHAILLNNALMDTRSRRPLSIPSHLQAPKRTRSYLIQTERNFDEVLPHPLMEALGATKVSYIPNNTWLVRVDPEALTQLENRSGVQSIVPYAPYFKISEGLLPSAVDQTALLPGTMLSLTVFPGESELAQVALEDLGLAVIKATSSPFGEQYVVHAFPGSLTPLANLDLVQWIEPWFHRALSSDLTRVRAAIDTDSTNLTNDNHHGLSGRSILININDTAVDSGHPDFDARVSVADFKLPVVASLPGDAGHGTHVAGIIVSSGANSPVVTNIINSATNANFHGMAPEAELYSLELDLLTGPLESDTELQFAAAEYNYITQNRTNAMISNNSWNYPESQEYGLASASYDAAVRDALPSVEGDQPMLYVFSAGNAGNGNMSGRGGAPGSILAPATAKNVITVGAIESLRYITNEVVVGYMDQVVTNEVGVVETNEIPIMEKAFLPETDSATEVASFSSRGNVGIGIEGEGGRFKPDVVAPGTYVVSTRSKDWEDPEDLRETATNRRQGISINPGDLVPSAVFVPSDGVELGIRLLPNEDASFALPDLPIYVALGRFPDTNDFAGLSEVTLKPDAGEPLNLVAGNVYFISIGNDTETSVVFDLETSIVTEQERDGFYEGLKMLNDGLGPHYRLESGTSMATPVVSGQLALMQQHLTEHGYNPSPALLKALLINGSRSSGTVYDFQVDPLLNYQGWGLPSLNNSLPMRFLETEDNKTSPVQFFDQAPDLAVATGESVSWSLNLSTNGARAFPLRFSLVWTDPPGNPAAGIKLVNDLDLVVSNAVSGEVFYGNDFGEASMFTRMSPSNSIPRADVVNNVENIYINGPLNTNYVVSVIGRRVNVNAVFDHPDGVVQDFALVISSGDDSELESPFELKDLETPLPLVLPPVIAITNGIPRLEDRVGANAPLLGSVDGLSQQWQFYMFTNSLPSTNDVGFTNGPNVAFVTFLPPDLARPRVSEADIDLYVSRDPSLMDLSPAAVAGANTSLNQGGTEVVLLENQPLGDDVVYYVGVKSEDHQGAQYAFVGLSQEDPFDFTDDNGNRVFRGIPLNQGVIPDGTPGNPGAGLGIAIGNPLNGLTVQSVTVEQTVVHQDIGDLLGSISHNGISAVLNNHTLFSPQGSAVFLDAVYDDFGSFANSIPSDGPGNLINFIGENGVGVWLMTMVDNALGQTGTLSGFRVVATPNQLLGDEGVVSSVQGETFAYFFVDVPADASAFTANLTEFELPLDLYLRHEELPTQTQYDKRTLGLEGESIVSVTLTPRDIPPLNAGRYFIGIYNPNPDVVNFRLTYDIERNLIIDAEQPFYPDEIEVPILDFGRTESPIFIPDARAVSEAKVGLRLDHPRLSDLSVHLVSPKGTRVLLVENRGTSDVTGFGQGSGQQISYGGFSDNLEDSDTLIKFAQGPFSTNVNVNVTPVSGFEQASAGIYAAGTTFSADADGNNWNVVAGRTRILDRFAPYGSNYLNIFSSRIATSVITEPGRKVDLFYSTRSSAGRGSSVGVVYLDGRRAQLVDGSIRWRRNTPVRFVPARPETLLEFTFVKGRPPMSLDEIEIRDAAAVKFFLPEEPLESLKGESAMGDWSLEINDTRDGGMEPLPMLQNWQLLLSLANTNVQAVTLRNGQCFTGQLDADEVNYFVVEVPRVATMATNWLKGSGDLEMWFDHMGVPTGESPPDMVPPIDFNGVNEGEGMLISVDGMTFFDPETNKLGTLASPVLKPGQRYYLAVANNKSAYEQDYELCLQFDADDVHIIDLTNQIPYSSTIPFTEDIEMQYYRYRTGSNVVNLDFELEPVNGDVNMVEKHGLPLPNLALFDQRSDFAGLQTEMLSITNIPPATILPGSYYIGVYNVEPSQTAVDYNIKVTETTVPYNIIRLTDGEAIDFTVGDNFASDDGMIDNYFMFEVASTNAAAARFEIVQTDGDAQFVLEKEALPSKDNHRLIREVFSERPGSGKMLVRTNESQPSLDGNWFLAVLNQRSEDLNFTIRASLETNMPPVITLTNQVWMTNTVAMKLEEHPEEMDFYRFVVDPAAEEVTFTIDPIMGGNDGNVDLLLKKGKLPSLVDQDATSSNPGDLSETIVLDATSKVVLSGGEWYVAVVNREASAQVTYRIRGSYQAELSIIPLEDGILFPNTIAGNLPNLPATPDLYYFDVDEESTETTFQLSNLENGQAGNVDLLLQFDVPPDLQNFDYASINPDTLDEMIRLNQDSVPRIKPGRWYLAVINRESSEVDYQIMADQSFPDQPTFIEVPSDLLFLGDQICITWESEMGKSYWLEGKVLEEDPVWDGLAGPIVASDLLSEYCLDLPVEHQFFRVVLRLENETPSAFIDPIVDLRSDSICVSWPASVGQSYQLQGRMNLLEGAWSDIIDITADSAAMEHCFESTTPYRFFRVEQTESSVEPILPSIEPALALLNGQLCISWDTEPNRAYVVQGREGLDQEDWVDLDTLVATSVSSDYCIELTSPYRFFRILVGALQEPTTGESFVEASLLLDGNQVCIQWNAESGRSYHIDGIPSLNTPIWNEIATVLASGKQAAYCLDLPTENRFFRVRMGMETTQPSPEPSITGYIDPKLVLSNDQVCLTWEPQGASLYQVQGLEDLKNPDWEVLDTLSSSNEPLSYCLDLQGLHRLYRIAVIKSDTQIEDGAGVRHNTLASIEIDHVALDAGQVKLQWMAEPGSVCLISYADSLLGPWTNIPDKMTSSTGSYEFIDDGSMTGGLVSPRFYRVHLISSP
jgi:subtilisin-like proprotein convertase family protein